MDAVQLSADGREFAIPLSDQLCHPKKKKNRNEEEEKKKHLL